MATVLGQYKQYQEGLLKKISDGSLKQQELLAFQELNYRIATLELMQAYCRTAPVTTELSAIGYHYQLVIASFRALLTERRFGPKGDEQKVQQRASAARDRAQISGGGFQRSVPPLSELQRRDAGALPEIRPGNDQHGAPRLGQLPYKLHQY